MLAHIAGAESRVGRISWLAVTVACFSIAISMITSSYKGWQKSPVSTTITTHPITELDFPTVTVCPPRRSNTAVNHVLNMVKNVNFADDERNELLDMSKKVFIENPNKEHARKIVELLSIENLRSLIEKQVRMPKTDEKNVTTIKSVELQGSFVTPGFGRPEYRGDFYERNHSIHYVLDFPENIAKMVGDGRLLVSVRTNGKWGFRLQNETLTPYKKKLNMSTAEDFCVNLGGHLASVGSKEEQMAINNPGKGVSSRPSN